MSQSLDKVMTDFGKRVGGQWPDVLKDNTREVEGKLAYVDNWRDKPTARAWCDAIEIAASVGELPDLLSREEYIEKLQSWQDERTGLIPDPWQRPGEDDDPARLTDGLSRYHLLAVGYALECLGSQPRYVVKVVEDFEPGELLEHLDSLPWETRAWGGGDWIDCFGTGLYLNCKYFDGRRGPEVVIGWMQTHIDKSLGVWGRPTKEEGLLQPVNGYYRATRGTYAQFGVPVPYAEVTIDTVLRHTRENGNFESKNITACNLLDIVHPLWLCGRQTEYRREEIRQLMGKLVVEAVGRWVPGKGFAFRPGESTGLQGTEMWMSIIYLMADILGMGGCLGYWPRGVHRLEPAWEMGSWLV